YPTGVKVDSPGTSTWTTLAIASPGFDLLPTPHSAPPAEGRYEESHAFSSTDFAVTTTEPAGLGDQMLEEAQRQELSTQLADMTNVILSEQTLDTVLQLVATLAKQTVAETAGVGVTLLRDNRYVTAAYSDAFVSVVDNHQYKSGEGPCLQAAVDNQRYEIVDMAGETRWPGYTPRAHDDGISSSLSLPLTVHGAPIGAINFYSHGVGAFADAGDKALVFAEQASVILANAQAYASTTHVNAQLQEALKTREIIGEAKGILMERERINQDEAFDMLRRISQHQNIKLRTIAQQVVDSVQRTTHRKRPA
ncbi:MAG: GAF and ANTAR domain-containing protein, partial [Actinomycetota bacterium]|nr:GAF and ANTAR domain-containing protein [Actinomycetota bacterium]